MLKVVGKQSKKENTNCQSKWWLNVSENHRSSLIFICVATLCSFKFSFLLWCWHWAHDLLFFFRHKKILLKWGKISRVALKYLVLSPLTRLEMSRNLFKKSVVLHLHMHLLVDVCKKHQHTCECLEFKFVLPYLLYYYPLIISLIRG